MAMEEQATRTTMTVRSTPLRARSSGAMRLSARDMPPSARASTRPQEANLAICLRRA